MCIDRGGGGGGLSWGSTKCSTLCLTDDGVKIGVVMVGNSVNNALY